MVFGMCYIFVAYAIISLFHPASFQPDTWRPIYIPINNAEPYQYLQPKGKFISIDYSNRICPEYFGLRSAKCPKCVPRSCVTESDILCPYEQYTPCEGKCDNDPWSENRMQCYYECENRTTPTRFSAKGKLRSTLWPNVTFSGVRLIPYEIVRLPEVLQIIEAAGPLNRLNEDSKHAWLKQIKYAMWNITNGTKIEFVEKSSVKFKFANKDPVENITRYIKIVETHCLCGVNRVGRKPDDGDPDEVNETIIYFPTWMDHYQFDLREIYGRSPSIYHLLLHALGLGHTNNRVDRDNFLFVNYETIPDDFPETALGKFFDTDNVESPMFELYSSISINNSVMYMDGMAWSKYQSLTVFSPIVEVNPLGWQRKFEVEDKSKIYLLYGKLKQDFCAFYEKYPHQAPRLTWEETEEARNVKKCDDLIVSRTTTRKLVSHSSQTHFGANVSFECLNKKFIMLGDETRKCMRNGHWTGIQPVCMPAELVNYYCTYSSDDMRCERFAKTNEKRMHDINLRNVKRSVGMDYKHFESEFVSKEMNSTTDNICVGFASLFQQNSIIEVYLKQNGLWNVVWRGKSGQSFTVTTVKFDTNVEIGKVFKVKVVAKYISDIALQFFMKYFYVFSGFCDFE
ncbi:hypothetical protein B4U80_13545 [Leptotrombidium deliense]|uniref:Sushi domain-containing protein n=1 Tax=Leptotrombidium deliense TaxID=299467 RepID=A0A443S4N0_9ACAR|nr:hypothetical protein B4U80_13545 [Leptotrombidium deliense]